MATPIPKIISVDDHVVEPPHLWQTWLPEQFRERGPRVERHGLAGLEYLGGTTYEYGRCHQRARHRTTSRWLAGARGRGGAVSGAEYTATLAAAEVMRNAERGFRAEKLMGHLPADAVHKIVRGNAIRMLSLPLDN